MKYRNQYCREINNNMIGERVLLCGWVHNKRDHGGIVFIDLRDFGNSILQCRYNGQNDYALESVIQVQGVVVERPGDNKNDNMENGDVEVEVDEIKVISDARPLPFSICKDETVGDRLRFAHRFLDIRRASVREKLFLRSKVISFMRHYCEEHGFLEVQTPILSASVPEGARDYVVPSRIHKGKFYALPQAPQIFKQLLMCSGIEKYFQIAPCFRDEDSRADRTPGEFYQLDLEMSFATQEDIINFIGPLLKSIYEKFGKYDVCDEIQTFTYHDSMEFFGNDKPDLRNPLRMCDVTIGLKDVSIFKDYNKPYISALKVNNVHDKSNKWFQDLNSFAVSLGLPGLGYVKYTDGEYTGPMNKFLSDDHRDYLKTHCAVDNNCAIFLMCSEHTNAFYDILSKLRVEIGNALTEILSDKYHFCWIVDFPFYHFDEDTNKYDFFHNPFSMPKCSIDEINKENLLDIKSHQYDIVCNGIEISSGAVRNNSVEMMQKVFNVIGYSNEYIKQNFNSLYSAMHFGCPPHAGIAPGVDRIIMMLLDTNNVRDVIYFPMSQTVESELFQCPSDISPEHLKELSLKIDDDTL